VEAAPLIPHMHICTAMVVKVQCAVKLLLSSEGWCIVACLAVPSYCSISADGLRASLTDLSQI